MRRRALMNDKMSYKNFITATITGDNNNTLQILGDGFDITQIKNLYIDDELVETIKTYVFGDTNEHVIIYELNEGFTTMKQMFEHCKMSSFDFNNLDTSSVTSFEKLFHTCLNLVTIYNFDKVNSQNVTNMRYTFRQCQKLISVDVSKLKTNKVTDMCEMFGYCISLMTLNVSNFNTSNVINMDGLFLLCNKLKTLDVSSFNTSKVNYMQSMFMSCTSLKNIDVSNFNTKNVLNMSHMFDSCSLLTSIDCSSFDTQKVQRMDGIFSSCSGLTTIDVSNFITSNVTDMSTMFIACTNLKSIIGLDKFDTSNVSNFERMFSSCSKLTELDLSTFDTSATYYYIGKLVGSNMSNIFYNCTSLTSVKMLGPTNNTSDVTDMFLNVTTNGTFTYSSNYNYNHILNKLPSTWTKVRH